MKFVYIVLIFAGSSLCYASSGMTAEAPLELTISFDKDEYKQSDPIYINFKLKNKGKNPIYVNDRFFLNSESSKKKDREVYLSVVSPKGKELPCKASYETGLPRTDNFVLLKPQEEASPKRKRGVKHYFDFKESGVYKITAVYQNVYGREIGVGAYKGKIVSKPVTIKIVK